MRAVIAAVVALAGCASHTTYKTARPLGVGQTRVLVAPELHGGGDAEGGKAVLPELAISVRRGVTDRVELNGTLAILPLGEALTSVGGELGGKLALGSRGRYSLALGGGAGYRATGSSGAVWEVVHVAVPLIAGVRLGRHELVLSPTVGWQRMFSSGAHDVDVPFVGASLGFEWRLTPRWALLPEIGSYYSPIASPAGGETRLVHVGVAIVTDR